MKNFFLILFLFFLILFGQLFGEYHRDNDISTEILYDTKKDRLLVAMAAVGGFAYIYFAIDNKTITKLSNALLKAKEWDKVKETNDVKEYRKHLFDVKIYDIVVSLPLNNSKPISAISAIKSKLKGDVLAVFYMIMSKQTSGIYFSYSDGVSGDEVSKLFKAEELISEELILEKLILIAFPPIFGKRNLLKEFRQSYLKYTAKQNAKDNLFK